MTKFFFSIFTFSLLTSTLKANKLTCNELTNEEPDLNFNVRFLLYNSNNNLPSMGLKHYLEEQNFDPSKNTKIIIPGFLQTHNDVWVKNMASKLKEMDPTVNIILVDWSNGFLTNFFKIPLFDFGLDLEKNGIVPFGTPNYRRAALGTERAAKELARILSKIEEAFDKKFNNLHIIGHSLGSHVAGQTARLRKLANEKLVDRITALDPAYPCFQDNSSSLRLKKEDALFVDVIHTNSGPGENLGIYEPIGHMDFYPNGGDEQDNCKPKNENRRKKRQIINLALSLMNDMDTSGLTSNFLINQKFGMLCSHLEAQKFFTKSLDSKKEFLSNPTKFPIKVDNYLIRKNKICTKKTCVEMGINAEKYNEEKNYGVYFYTANNKALDRY